MLPLSKMEGDPLVAKIDAILPQTQCRQCSFPGCYPYAVAIANGEANINQCPPGGDATIAALAKLLGREPEPLNTKYGVVKPKMLAIIDEARCIGCTLCIQACPVDAILGTAKQMHTVILNECTGCELCVAPCPIDCIDMVPINGEPLISRLSTVTDAQSRNLDVLPSTPMGDLAESSCSNVSHSNISLMNYYQLTQTENAAQEREKQKADVARSRYRFRLQRLEREKLEHATRYSQKKAALTAQAAGDYGNIPASGSSTDSDPKQTAVLAAIVRAKAKHAALTQSADQYEIPH